MLEIIKEIIVDVLPDCDISTITKESCLSTDLGIDSMKMLMIALQIEDRFQIQFEDDVKLDTVQDLLDYISTHQN